MELIGNHETPMRGDAVERWIKRRRDECGSETDDAWRVLDDLLDEYRLRADTGTPLHLDNIGPHEERGDESFTDAEGDTWWLTSGGRYLVGPDADTAERNWRFHLSHSGLATAEEWVGLPSIEEIRKEHGEWR